MPPPPQAYGGSGTLSDDNRCLSICLSVCPVPDPKSRSDGRSKLKIGRMEAHDTSDPWPHLEVKRFSMFEILAPVAAT